VFSSSPTFESPHPLGPPSGVSRFRIRACVSTRFGSQACLVGASTSRLESSAALFVEGQSNRTSRAEATVAAMRQCSAAANAHGCAVPLRRECASEPEPTVGLACAGGVVLLPRQVRPPRRGEPVRPAWSECVPLVGVPSPWQSPVCPAVAGGSGRHCQQDSQRPRVRRVPCALCAAPAARAIALRRVGGRAPATARGHHGGLRPIRAG
jgi:hypothetical protein